MVKLKKIFGIKKDAEEKRYYALGKYKIELKAHHILDKFQEKFPLYDRFLPLVCADFEGLIIDIGANIGDTSLAVFSQNQKSFVVGVEPDKEFFEDCIININNNQLSSRFLAVNKFVTTSKGNFKIKKNESLSTGSIEKNLDGKESNTISFSELMEMIPAKEKTKFDILKIDTDGYDWDILKSFSEYSSASDFLPRFIFFEMQTFLNNNETNDEGREEITNNYHSAIKGLIQSGYTNFCLFDNFGTHVKKTKSIDEIFDLVAYTKRSQVFNKHSTIYYFDVLAYRETEESYLDRVLEKLYAR